MGNTKNITVLFTGGHATPAVAVCEEIRKSYPSWNILWVGRTRALEGSDSRSSEYALVSSMHIPFIPLTAGRLQRRLSFHTIPSLLKFPIGIVEALGILRQYKPTVIVTFGGYVALPVAIAGFFLGIPVMTHEQVETPGLANAIINRIAKRVCVSFPETLSRVPKGKGVVTGLPVRPVLFSPPETPSFSYKEENLPVLYITGGSTGSRSLNEKLYPIIPQLVQRFLVIHQTGDVSLSGANEVKKQLGPLGGRYIIASYFSGPDVAWIYRHARVVLGRSGANTVGELSALQKSAILIPLPWSANNEQARNAERYAATGQAIVIQQDQVSKDSVDRAINTLLFHVRKPHPAVRNGHSATLAVVKEIHSLICAELNG